MRTVKLVALAVLLLAAAATQSLADQIWDFSISNTEGNTPGTVTGEIVLPFTGNGTGSASQVFIDTLPAGFPSPGPLPYDLLAPQANPVIVLNSFLVSGGVLESLEFATYTNGETQPDFLLSMSVSVGGSVGTFLYDDRPSGPFDSISGIPVYTLVSSPTPEPATTTLLASGFFAFGGLRFNRRRRRPT